MPSATTPFFSIVLPTYSRAHIIRVPIDSVLAQTFDNWELIVVDDGSRDNTREVVTAYNDPRIKYVYQDNAERSAARNNGIAHANGEYICFLDSDDYYFPTHLASLHQAIQEKNKPVGFFISHVTRNENGSHVPVAYEDSSAYINGVCFILCASESVIPSRVAIHNSILRKYQFDLALKDVEDTDLWVRIAAHYPLYFTGKATAVYSIHDSNSTNKANNPFANQLKGLKKIFRNPEINRLTPSSIRQKKLASCYFGIAQYYEYAGSYWKMVYNLLLSIYYSPFAASTKTKVYMIVSGLLKAMGIKR